jgi:hypothetical protein
MPMPSAVEDGDSPLSPSMLIVDELPDRTGVVIWRLVRR